MAQGLGAWHCGCCGGGLIRGREPFHMPRVWKKKKKKKKGIGRVNSMSSFRKVEEINNFLKKEKAF